MSIADFQVVLTEENAGHAAREIVEHLMRTADSKNVDYDFHVDPKSLKMTVDRYSYEIEQEEAGDIEAVDSESRVTVDKVRFDAPIESWEPNTNFTFDTAPQTFLRELINFLKTQDEISESEILLMRDWLVKVRDHINTDWAEEVKNALRSKVVKQTAEVVPMERMTAINVEIDRLPDPAKGEGSPYLISIAKLPKSNVPNSVGSELLALMGSTGKHPNDIIKEKKEQGDPNYADVVGASVRQSTFEVRVDFFVDYSMTRPDHAKPEETSVV